ncbi:glycosyltransferase family 4 protein [Flavobacterium sp. 245]|uniref:glycosyltransferase family 4 protein n=1 Tax=Flavobacterium sp. 245 TaxID=2512115 RepID=UPI00105B5444|nr:glycosyltransferase family 4 protein [Flavobacterium sp. 245]TDP02428.1 glycosyltransferase involved in cell wall biosynthesis [Flavobacterium sp. 245]
MKIALVQDWLTELGGAEKVFRSIYDLYPDADIYTLVYNPEVLKKMNISESKVTASFIQRLPFGKTKYRNYLPLFTKAIESFDFSQYDLVISSSYSVAKGVLTNSSQVHICYCHSPVRYAWDLYHQYLNEAGLKKGLKSIIVKHYLHKLRIWDIISTNRVDYFICNSNYIKNRIAKLYRRDAEVIYPPISIEEFPFLDQKEDYFITCSRLVPYKRIDLIVQAFSLLPNLKLKVIGDGPEMSKIKSLAKSNVEILGYQEDNVLKKELSNARAFVFAAEEDFGIIPIEAQACGTPIIAFGKGGALETVIENETGVFFEEQTVESLIDAINRFLIVENNFLSDKIRDNASRFVDTKFKNAIIQFVNVHTIGKNNKKNKDLLSD